MRTKKASARMPAESANPINLRIGLSAKRESGKDAEPDERCCGHYAGAVLEAHCDRRVVVCAVGVFLVHARNEEELVVHREPNRMPTMRTGSKLMIGAPSSRRARTPVSGLFQPSGPPDWRPWPKTY